MKAWEAVAEPNGPQCGSELKDSKGGWRSEFQPSLQLRSFVFNSNMKAQILSSKEAQEAKGFNAKGKENLKQLTEVCSVGNDQGKELALVPATMKLLSNRARPGKEKHSKVMNIDYFLARLMIIGRETD